MLKEMILTKKQFMAYCEVLILILMEHAQRGFILKTNNMDYKVLILILMEHAQRAKIP